MSRSACRNWNGTCIRRLLFGVAYALRIDGHVRVDVIYERLAPRRRAVIDILGTILLLWPFCFWSPTTASRFAHEAYSHRRDQR